MAEEGAPKEGSGHRGPVNEVIVRSFKEEMKFIRRVTPWKFEIDIGFVPGMNVPGVFYVNAALENLILDELRLQCNSGGVGGFLPAVKQIANVAALPGIVKRSIGLPDVHSGITVTVTVTIMSLNIFSCLYVSECVRFQVICYTNKPHWHFYCSVKGMVLLLEM